MNNNIVVLYEVKEIGISQLFSIVNNSSEELQRVGMHADILPKICQMIIDCS